MESGMTALIISALCLNQSTRSHLPVGARDGQHSQREIVLLGFGNRAYPGTDQSALNVQHQLASADLGVIPTGRMRPKSAMFQHSHKTTSGHQLQLHVLSKTPMDGPSKQPARMFFCFWPGPQSP